MPTYEYQCKACGNKFEAFQSISAKPIKKCPACGKNTVQRLISAGAGIIFKGSGFYETDYRSESYKSAAKKETPTAETAKPAADGKNNSAPAVPATSAAAPATPSAAPAAESKPAASGKKLGKSKS
ncbi:MAG: FmdB family zinc ribbon protein [Phycisphaerae bacterium]